MDSIALLLFLYIIIFISILFICILFITYFIKDTRNQRNQRYQQSSPIQEDSSMRG